MEELKLYFQNHFCRLLQIFNRFKNNIISKFIRENPVSICLPCHAGSWSIYDHYFITGIWWSRSRDRRSSYSIVNQPHFFQDSPSLTSKCWTEYYTWCFWLSDLRITMLETFSISIEAMRVCLNSKLLF